MLRFGFEKTGVGLAGRWYPTRSLLAVEQDLPCCIRYSNTVGVQVEMAFFKVGRGTSIGVMSIQYDIRFLMALVDGVLCVYPFPRARKSHSR